MLNESNKNKVSKFIKSNLMNLIVFLSAVAYIFYGQIGIELNSQTVIVLTTSAILGFVVGLIIKQAIGENGITKGYSSEIWQNAFQKIF